MDNHFAAEYLEADPGSLFGGAVPRPQDASWCYQDANQGITCVLAFYTTLEP